MTLERKRYLDGREVTFACQLVAMEKGFGILKYVLAQAWHARDLTLPPGTVTYAFYWTARPYNLYWWQDPDGVTLGYYFNLADEVRLSPQAFVWHDLVIDVLVQPAAPGEAWQVHVLDEDELPAALDQDLQAYVASARAQVLQHYPDVIREARQALERQVRCI